MTKFINLTERYNTQLHPLILNTAFIQHIKIGDKGRDTMVQLQGGKFFFVQETVEHIWNMLNYIPPARMMNGGDLNPNQSFNR